MKYVLCALLVLLCVSCALAGDEWERYYASPYPIPCPENDPYYTYPDDVYDDRQVQEEAPQPRMYNYDELPSLFEDDTTSQTYP